jgi:hypothetical protein
MLFFELLFGILTPFIAPVTPSIAPVTPSATHGRRCKPFVMFDTNLL